MTNKAQVSVFARQVADLITTCRDYDEMQREILTLLGSYVQAAEHPQDTQAFGEVCDPVLLLLDRLRQEKEQQAVAQQAQVVKSAMNTLSYTELEVIIHIFDALGGSEGVLIAGKVADGLRITRSVVVSALRKLESAQIIETRSLGVKGTFIRVLNPLWHQELRKLKA